MFVKPFLLLLLMPLLVIPFTIQRRPSSTQIFMGDIFYYKERLHCSMSQMWCAWMEIYEIDFFYRERIWRSTEKCANTWPNDHGTTLKVFELFLDYDFELRIFHNCNDRGTQQVIIEKLDAESMREERLIDGRDLKNQGIHTNKTMEMPRSKIWDYLMGWA